jgi:hypothetical protein
LQNRRSTTELRPHAYLRLDSPKQARMSSALPADKRTAHEERIILVQAELASRSGGPAPMRHPGLVVDRDDLLAHVERSVGHRLGGPHPETSQASRSSGGLHESDGRSDRHGAYGRGDAPAPKPCPAGVGVKGGTSRAKGSGSRLRLWVCGCEKRVQIRVASDDFRVHCDACGEGPDIGADPRGFKPEVTLHLPESSIPGQFVSVTSRTAVRRRMEKWRASGRERLVSVRKPGCPLRFSVMSPYPKSRPTMLW